MQALKALEGYVNRTGGINGQPISFVAADDRSDPKTALVLAQGLIATKVPVILGPSSPQACAAVAPIIAQNGPVLYCTANAGDPPAGGYEFMTTFPFEPEFAVLLRYLRERGLHRVGYLISTDAGGLLAEKGLVQAAARPENRSMRIVASEHFAPTDLSATAQMARIEAAKPDALVLWGTGTSGGTMLHSEKDLGIDLPTVTSPANLNDAFLRQYAALLPTNLYFITMPYYYYAGNAATPPAVKDAIDDMTTAFANIDTKPQEPEIVAWDVSKVVVDALRKLGTAATAAQLHAYLETLTKWTGANGPYNYQANPQRGIEKNDIIIVRWDARRGSVVPATQLGGEPLR